MILVNLVIVIIGGFALASQILLIRELLSIFYGNELAIGVMLASWLFWVSVGSSVTSIMVDRLKQPVRMLSITCLGLGIVLPLTILGLRSVRLFLDFHPGQIVGLIPVFITSFILLAPIGIMVGNCFSTATKSLSITQECKEASIGRVYFLEAIGSGIIGALLHYLLINIINPVLFSIITGIVMVLMALALIVNDQNKFLIPIKIFQVITLVFGVGIIIGGYWVKLNETSLKWKWGELNVIAEKDSKFGKITVVDRNTQVSFFENGLLQFTYPDRLNAEEKIHYALLQHPDPRKVLLIGGGLGGALKELVKYKLVQVDYVELDPAMIDMGRKFLPMEISMLLEHPSVKLYLTDGRAFLKQSGNKYQVIIVDAPDPSTAQVNRYYTREFFLEIKKLLHPNGVLYFQVVSSPNYISEELGQFLNCIKDTLQSVFEKVILFPGDNCGFFATMASSYLVKDPGILVTRLKERNINTLYVSEYYMPYNLTPERFQYLDESLTETKKKTGVFLNSDLKPVCYYFDMVLYSTYFKGKMNPVFNWFLSFNWTWGMGIILVVFIAISVLVNKFRRLNMFYVLVPVGTTGMAEIVFEVLILFLFQSFFGLLYSSIGLILSAFMVGLACGGYMGTKKWVKHKIAFKAFRNLQIGLILFIIILIFNVYVISNVNFPLWFASGKFIFLTLVAGFLGGAQFPVAASLYGIKSRQTGRTAGLLYGVDLAGSCIGALFFSAIIIPLTGVIITLVILECISVGSLFVLLAGRDQLG